MGCLNSKSNDYEFQYNYKIEKKLKQVEVDQANQINLLLLGTGDSGKSTIVNQMRILYNNGFTQKQRIYYHDVINSNIIENMKVLIFAIDSLQLGELKGESKTIADKILDIKFNFDLSPKLAEELTTLWNDKLIQSVYQKRNKFHIPESMNYYYNKLKTIADPNYLPSDEDILLCRVRTSGINQTNFSMDDFKFTIIDVGGQRNERKKWISCFEGITALLYISSISEYNQQLFEDQKVNRMHESLSLYESTINSKWFEKTPIILFLNKIDLFKEKIKKHDLSVCFPDYKDGLDEKKSREYIKNKFIEKNLNKNKEVYSHFTCATDTSNIKFVFESIKDIILSNMVKTIGNL
ncbi:guanine nucleotide-binding protein g(o) subunit alpha [Anaeramoeba flamelloides]|uniref:Guanine nucleotide-binding protein g(O) subunit alpha n=1 Tax=Anaeramoeba flamelloides TaxID=1746091 RepID=A0AAV8A0X3_9EUKA|nr:guanine nucleotide-binding protein g(o) subunit alpha [Anaeramoeba flamelloides]